MSSTTLFQFFPRNSSYALPGIYDLNVEDTAWLLLSSFIIFTMQSGFALIESGCVSIKNETNIMLKNIIDTVLGGFSFWLIGYGLAFGRGAYTNSFIGVGDFLLNPKVGDPLMGPIFAAFAFQLSFATTATTIISGAMAERCNMRAYCIFSFLNTIVYSISAGWMWGEHGFLHNLGVVDIAGTGAVHLVGGASSISAAYILGPRLGRYDDGNKGPPQMGNPSKVGAGMFLLWWGWLAFNSGSSYGVSNSKHHYAARAAAGTMLASMGGGIMSLIYSMVRTGGRLEISYFINGVISGLVAISAGCFLFDAWECFLVGQVSSLLTCLATPLFDKLHIDDPLGSIAVHFSAGIWGLIAIGLFADNPIPLSTTSYRAGLFKDGGWHLLGVQSLAAACLIIWSLLATYALLWSINKCIPIRMDPNDEILGADIVEHNYSAMPLAPQKYDFEEVATISKDSGNPELVQNLMRHRRKTVPQNSSELSQSTESFGLNGQFTQQSTDSIPSMSK